MGLKVFVSFCSLSEQQHCILLTSVRILGGSCNNEWILEEANDDNGDIASCMERTDEDENGEQISYIEKLKQCAACRLARAPSVNHRPCCMWLLGRTFSLGGLACVR